VLAVGDTTYLDYKQIIAKRDGYGPIGNGGNGLICTRIQQSSFRTVVGFIVAETLAWEAKAKPPRMKPQAESLYLR